jgi:hypothetical protein
MAASKFPVIRCEMCELTQRGTLPTLDLRPLLAQHSLAPAAGLSLRCSACRRTGRSRTSILARTEIALSPQPVQTNESRDFAVAQFASSNGRLTDN